MLVRESSTCLKVRVRLLFCLLPFAEVELSRQNIVSLEMMALKGEKSCNGDDGLVPPMLE